MITLIRWNRQRRLVANLLVLALSLLAAACGAEPTAAPTEIAQEPVDSPVPATDTSIPPTDTDAPPTNTPVPPTNTPVPPTDTPIPPADTPTLTPTPAPTAPPTPSMTTEELLEQVTTLYTEGNLEEALDVVDQAIAVDPWQLVPYHYRHILRSELEAMAPLEEVDRMIAEYDGAIANDGEDAGAYYLRGVARYQRTVLSGEPFDEEPLFEDTPGVTVYGDPPMYGHLILEHAIADLDQAIELDPEYAEAYHVRGLAYHLQSMAYIGIAPVDFYPEDLELAIQDYGRALDLEPGLAAGYHDRGTAYAQRGWHLGRHGDATSEEVVEDLEQALGDFALAVELDPEAKNTYFNRACTCSTLAYHLENAGEDTYDSLQQMLDDANRVIELDPENLWAYYFRAMAHLDLAELAEDESAAEQHESQANADYETFQTLGEVLFQRYEISDLYTRILTLSSGPPISPDEASAAMLGVLEGGQYTSPDDVFRLEVPALMQPNAVIWDEQAATGDLLVWFEDDLARWYALQMHPGTLGGQPLEEWVEENLAVDLDVQEQRQEDTSLGPAIILLYRYAEFEADCCLALAHQDSRFYAASYCLMDHYAGEGEAGGIRVFAGGYGISYEPVDVLALSLLEGLEVLD